MISTLDASLQQAAWQALGDRRGAVVAMEPDTGKILAMVSKPDYDLIPPAWIFPGKGWWRMQAGRASC